MKKRGKGEERAFIIKCSLLGGEHLLKTTKTNRTHENAPFTFQTHSTDSVRGGTDRAADSAPHHGLRDAQAQIPAWIAYLNRSKFLGDIPERSILPENIITPPIP